MLKQKGNILIRIFPLKNSLRYNEVGQTLVFLPSLALSRSGSKGIFSAVVGTPEVFLATNPNVMPPFELSIEIMRK